MVVTNSTNSCGSDHAFVVLVAMGSASRYSNQLSYALCYPHPCWNPRPPLLKPLAAAGYMNLDIWYSVTCRTHSIFYNNTRCIHFETPPHTPKNTNYPPITIILLQSIAFHLFSHNFILFHFNSFQFTLLSTHPLPPASNQSIFHSNLTGGFLACPHLNHMPRTTRSDRALRRGVTPPCSIYHKISLHRVRLRRSSPSNAIIKCSLEYI